MRLPVCEVRALLAGAVDRLCHGVERADPGQQIDHDAVVIRGGLKVEVRPSAYR